MVYSSVDYLDEWTAGSGVLVDGRAGLDLTISVIVVYYVYE
jgi:hypothetical protein